MQQTNDVDLRSLGNFELDAVHELHEQARECDAVYSVRHGEAARPNFE